MRKKTTLQDIALAMGISVGTVHKALYNKKGVSEKKRQLIISTAKEMQYESSGLTIQEAHEIAILFPKPITTDKYFYQYIWKGIEQRAQELSPNQFKILEFTFDGTQQNQLEMMEKILKDHGDTIDGLLTIIWDEFSFQDILKEFTNKGIKIFTVSSDAPFSNRTSSIMTNPYQMGRLAAEYLGSVIPSSGRVIIMGTRRDSANHAQVVRGFFDQMSKTNPAIQIIELYESVVNPKIIYETLEDFLSKFDDIHGIYINNARTTAGVYKVFRDNPKKEQLKLIGAEIFQESVQGVQENIFQALIDQNPFEQGYKAVSIAYENIAQNREVLKKYDIPISLYLSNNLPDYR